MIVSGIKGSTDIKQAKQVTEFNFYILFSMHILSVLGEKNLRRSPANGTPYTLSCVQLLQSGLCSDVRFLCPLYSAEEKKSHPFFKRCHALGGRCVV